MDDEATVACEICGAEVVVTLVGTLYPALLARQLPVGWIGRKERDVTTGQLLVRCPRHRDA